MSRIALWTVVALMLVGGAWFLGRTGTDHAAETNAETVEQAPSVRVERPAGDFVIASVDGEPIYRTDFLFAVQSLPANAQAMAGKPEGKRLILEELIKLKVLKQEARRRGLDQEPEIAAQIESAMDSMLAAAAIERLVSESPGDLRAFYDAYTNQFRGTNARQILIAFEGGLVPPRGGGTAMTEADARAKAQDLARRIRSGEAFGAIAAAESDDTQSAQAGGSVGLVRPGQLGSLLDSEIEKLAIGEVSEPIKSAYGIHVFEVTGREVSSFEEIEGALQQQGGQLRARIVLNDLREKARVKIENEQFFEPVLP